MRNRKSLFATVFMLMIGMAMIAAMGISNVSAQATPEIVVTPHLVTGAGGAFISYKFNIRNAPHDTHEPAQKTVDKTWGWQIELNWDPAVLDCPTASYITEDAAYSFLGSWTYFAATPFPPFYEEKPYPRSGISVALSPGKLVIQDALKSDPDVTTVPIDTTNDPNAGLHLGSNYDLPYTTGLPAAGGYSASERNLFTIWFAVKTGQDGPPHSSPIRINKATIYFWCHDMTTIYHVLAEDAWFGVIGPHLHCTSSVLDLTVDPTCTTWHELYPVYCNEYHLDDWHDDSGDGAFGHCDEILLTPTDPAGPAMWYHVEEVTITLYLEKKPLPSGVYMYVDLDVERLEEPPVPPITSPISTQWHELYPAYCTNYHLSDWSDTGPDNPGELGPSDQIWLTDKETGVTAEYHVVDISTDIIVKPEPDKPVPEFPLGIEIVMMLALLTPLIYLWRRKGWKK